MSQIMGKSIENQTGDRVFEKKLWKSLFSTVFYDQLQKY